MVHPLLLPDWMYQCICLLHLWIYGLKHFRPDFCFPGVCSGMSTFNPAETLLPGGFLWHVHLQTEAFSLISASRGFALACPPPNPAEALSA